MTDNEIIKALECCCNYFYKRCDLCPLYEKDCDDCQRRLCKYALSLINRQKAEIERLQNLLNEKAFILAENRKNEIKAEAIKEFAERLKKQSFVARTCEDSKFESVVRISSIDNLVKEMVGDE